MYFFTSDDSRHSKGIAKNGLPPFVRFKNAVELPPILFLFTSDDDAVFADKHPHTDTHIDILNLLLDTFSVVVLSFTMQCKKEKKKYANRFSERTKYVGDTTFRRQTHKMKFCSNILGLFIFSDAIIHQTRFLSSSSPSQ
jgi:hypothetical protein